MMPQPHPFLLHLCLHFTQLPYSAPQEPCTAQACLHRHLQLCLRLQTRAVAMALHQSSHPVEVLQLPLCLALCRQTHHPPEQQPRRPSWAPAFRPQGSPTPQQACRPQLRPRLQLPPPPLAHHRQRQAHWQLPSKPQCQPTA